MKAIIQDDRRYMLRFDKGEDVISGLADFMKSQSIGACVFFGIGACESVELGYFNPFLKDYRKKPYVEELEIATFSGNGSLSGGQPSIHAHGVFSRNDFTSLAGHVFKLVVSVTCEILLIKLEGQMNRGLNAEFNLNLLQ
ncbi:MAG: DNA-binding protein [Candidatus Doudnabacteria bacterium]|nr:DNA-binding protein [Candidatus Doudnabacteria bacterium]